MRDEYKVPETKEEQQEIADKLKVKIDGFRTDREFHSQQIGFGGKTPPRFSDFFASMHGGSMSQDVDEQRKLWKGISEEIPGLHCPDCYSQAFKTDQKNVAVCGAYPGWYFFYRRTDMDVDSKTKLVIRNGELVEAESIDVESEAV